MNEKDFEYLNNIDTRPGPNAGRSIDPTKPGPDADAAAIAQSDAEPVAWRETLTAARDEIISLLPQDWFENGFLKEPHPVIDKIDTALAAPPRPDASAGLIEAAVLERYAQSIAMWMDRENVTDQERLSYIKGHPVTRKFRARAVINRSGK